MTDTDGILAKVRSLREEIRSRAAEGDRENRFPYEDLALLKGHGLFALAVPREYGGLGATIALCNEVYRELAKANSSTAQVFFVHTVCALLVRIMGSHEQQARFFREIVDRGARIGVAASEPGIHVFDWRGKLAPTNGGYLLNGVKHFCTGHEGAELIQVFAILEGSPSLAEGVLVCMAPSKQEGITLHNDWDAMGQRQTSSGTITFRNVFVHEEDVLGKPGEVLSMSPSLFAPYYQSGFAAIYTGIAEGAYEAALEYVRHQTRPWPLADVDAAVKDPYIAKCFGEMRVKIDSAKVLLERASAAIDAAGERLVSRGEAAIATSIVKVAATEAALEVTHKIFQVCGARSTYRKFGFDRYWRDARTLTLHDPVDWKIHEVGVYDLTGTEPPVGFYT
jgi:alkylation response protein AidB-like acyl-CoA dehydrogenase